MKLSCVQNIQLDKRNSNNNKKTNNSPNFTGFAAGCANFWKFVDAGGPALQFTVEDCSETNVPRSLRGLLAGYKYTGKLNILGFLQEAIREFLTGPTMCVMPVAILAFATKISGKTANTHVENILNLSYLTQNTQINDAKNFKNTFFINAVEDMLKQSVDTVNEDDVKTLVKGLTDFNNATDKKQANKILAELQKTFGSIVKREKTSYKGVNFDNAFYSISKEKKGSTSFKSYIGYISARADDFTKKLDKNGVSNLSDALKSFKTNWIGKRLFVVGAMFGITTLVMSFIPKIYTLASGKVNPNASTIYNEANKENKQTPKDEKEVK